MEPVVNAVRLISWRWFVLAGLLFFTGMALGPVVYRRRIGWLLAYPRRVARFLEEMLARYRTFAPLFLRIFLINTASILTDFLSGFGIVLPFIVILWTGLNMALLAGEVYGEPVRWTRLLNFLALFELPAAWAMTAAGVELGLAVAGRSSVTVAAAFTSGWRLFFLFSWPLLLVAGVLEAGLIAAGNRHGELGGNGRLRTPKRVTASLDSDDSVAPREDDAA